MLDKMPDSPRVSIIMRSKNSDWVIGQALAGLFSQSFTDFELLVVDSGSTDNTLDIVSNYPCRLIEIEATDYYPGQVLNAAIRETRADIVVFQNSDTVPLHQHTLKRLLAGLDDDKVAAAFTRQIPRPEAHTWVRRDYAMAFPEAGDTPDWLTMSLPMAAMRKSVWKEHPFYTDAWGSEDTEWAVWAKNQGYAIRYVPDALVMHSHNYTLEQMYGRRFIEGEADAFIYRDHDSLLKLAQRIIASTARDAISHVQAGDWPDLFKIPARRTAYHWGYYKGHKLGEQRIKTGNLDTSLGQKTVLNRYG
ncbi:MAG: glycosyltransferase family A protein [Mariprofundaceae bacterium]